MSNELGTTNETLGHLWQTQAHSRQVRAEVISVPVSAYVPVPAFEIEPRVVEARDAATVIEHHLPAVTMPARSPSKDVRPTAETSTHRPARPTRQFAQRDVQRRTAERRTTDVRTRHDRATRTDVTRHAEASKAVRPEAFAAASPTIVATAPAKTFDVRRPTSIRPVEASAAAHHESAGLPRKARATPREAVVEAKRATQTNAPTGHVDVVA